MTKPPLLLAIETSSEVGSVALGRGFDVLRRGWLLRQGQHASGLVPAIADILDRSGLERTDLDGLVVGRGPGSFTGLRIAAASARGLAKALRIPLWHYSSLATAAASLGAEMPEPSGARTESAVQRLEEAEGRPCFVLFDARAERLYGACYQILADRIVQLIAPTASTLSQVLTEEVPAGTFFCGDAALRHANRLQAVGYTILPSPAGLPTAEGLLRVHQLSSRTEPERPASQWEPEYLRGSPGTSPAVPS